MIVKKVVLAGAAVLAVAVLAWVISAAGGNYVAKRSAAQAWPATLGSLTAVPKRFPAREQNAAATKIVQLAAGADVNVAPLKPGDTRRSLRRDATDRLLSETGLYVTAQLERPGDAIEAPPQDVARFLETSDRQLTAVRQHLIHGGELQWASDVSRGFSAPVPNLLGHMNLQRLLIARALDRARSGNVAAWDELHASWELSRGLWGRPELISNIIALASARMMNAAARKMPTAEPPAWFVATRTFDPLKPIIAAHQVEAWQMHEAKPYDGGLAVEVQRAVMWPMDRFELAEAIDQTRNYVEAVERSGACDSRNVSAQLPYLQPNVTGVYQRALRLRVEMEATDRVLALRRGETPSTQSRCTDGNWVVTPASVKFSKAVPLSKPALQVPLEYSR